MSLVVELIFEILLEGILLGINRFLKNNSIPKFSRVLVVVFLFMIPIGLMFLLFPMFVEINTILTYVIFIIGILICLYFEMKLIYKINIGFDEKSN